MATSVVKLKPWANPIKRRWDLWRESFNYERPYEALGMRCPGERRVSASGAIRIDGLQLFLSNSLAGWSVGLKPSAADLMESLVWTASLGPDRSFDEQFIRADIRPNKAPRQRSPNNK